jgi:hypothetical protein
MRSPDTKGGRAAAVADLLWTGREVLHLRRFQDHLQAARGLLGSDDHLANLLLEDALVELQCVLGEQATPVAEGGDPGRDPLGLKR